jgi:hypothetical protein
VSAVTSGVALLSSAASCPAACPHPTSWTSRLPTLRLIVRLCRSKPVQGKQNNKETPLPRVNIACKTRADLHLQDVRLIRVGVDSSLMLHLQIQPFSPAGLVVSAPASSTFTERKPCVRAVLLGLAKLTNAPPTLAKRFDIHVLKGFTWFTSVRKSHGALERKIYWQ